MKQNKVSLSSKQYAVPFVLITSLFFMWGFARAILDVLNKHFQNKFFKFIKKRMQKCSV